MSCCGGKCGCGSSCSCGSGCTGCGMYPDVTENSTTAQTLVEGLAPTKLSYESSEMSNGSEHDGCSCGSSCSCDPCTCK